MLQGPYWLPYMLILRPDTHVSEIVHSIETLMSQLLAAYAPKLSQWALEA